MKLIWHGYRYYPYERELARREIAALFPGSQPREVPGGLELADSCSSRVANRLTYVSRIDGERGLSETQQSCLEMTARKGKARQATRYSVHGLHEYKGKFNPQVAKALLNVLGILPGQRVLDPFLRQRHHLGRVRTPWGSGPWRGHQPARSLHQQRQAASADHASNRVERCPAASDVYVAHRRPQAPVNGRVAAAGPSSNRGSKRTSSTPSSASAMWSRRSQGRLRRSSSRLPATCCATTRGRIPRTCA